MSRQGQRSRDFNEIEVSVVMPCLDEAKTLRTCIEKARNGFEEHDLRGEIVVVDNGSTDASPLIARQCDVILAHQPVRGYGAALRKAFEMSRGHFIVMADADDSYDFGEVHRFVEKLREGWDLVMGSRREGIILPGASPWLHRFVGVPFLTWILNLLYQVGISDAHCGMRGFRRAALNRLDLRTTGMELASEMLIKAAKAGLKITEIPIVLYPDGRDRPPHLRSIRDGWRHLRFMLLFAPNALFLLPGVLVGGVGLSLLAALLLRGRLHLGKVSLGENTMVLAMMMVVIGTQVLYLGLFTKLLTYTRFNTPDRRHVSLLLKLSKLEIGLLFGAVLLLVGLSGDGFVLKIWSEAGYGQLGLDTIRYSLFFSTMVMMGVQVIFSSFFLSMIGIDRATYAGDVIDFDASSES